jgi:hypothetical protein
MAKEEAASTRRACSICSKTWTRQRAWSDARRPRARIQRVEPPMTWLWRGVRYPPTFHYSRLPAFWTIHSSSSSSSSSFSSALFPPQEFTAPSVVLKNAAVPSTRHPLLGLGLRGSGFAIDWAAARVLSLLTPCAARESIARRSMTTRDWLRMGGVRLDTGYPFGDSHAAHDISDRRSDRSPKSFSVGSCSSASLRRRALSAPHTCRRTWMWRRRRRLLLRVTTGDSLMQTWRRLGRCSSAT